MKQQIDINFERISKAIEYLQTHYQAQPSLAQVAEEVHLSPYHFQRLFTEWAGVSPKKFLQYISLGHAKKLLREGKQSLFDTADRVGLSGTGRLHDLFVKIEGMTPGEYKEGGAQLDIAYHFANTPFGKILIASTQKGICHMSFVEEEDLALKELVSLFPKASYQQERSLLQEYAHFIFTQDWTQLKQIKLHLNGTPFQLKVWESLLKVPAGRLTTYGDVARSIEQPTASRAVGTAIGKNPVAYLIPCHRVIRSSGKFGEYAWGSLRKTALIGWEAAKVAS